MGCTTDVTVKGDVGEIGKRGLDAQSIVHGFVTQTGGRGQGGVEMVGGFPLIIHRQ